MNSFADTINTADVQMTADTDEEARGSAEATEEEILTYKDSTYEIVSKVAYLIGVRQSIFEKDAEAPKMDIFMQLEQDKSARIIRHLCIIRTAIERNFKNINE